MKKLLLGLLLFFGIYNFSSAEFIQTYSGSIQQKTLLGGTKSLTFTISSYTGTTSLVETFSNKYLKSLNCTLQNSYTGGRNILSINICPNNGTTCSSFNSIKPFIYELGIKTDTLTIPLDYVLNSTGGISYSYSLTNYGTSGNINLSCTLFYTSFIPFSNITSSSTGTMQYLQNPNSTSTGYINLAYQDNYGNYFVNFDSFKTITFFFVLTIVGLTLFISLSIKFFNSGRGKNIN